ncbi:hypothetical protein FACS189499_04790 [Clostridia bacterium]|nr:hypothetical protein FACS189499_04790 [Clostridia bacterium]
MNGKQFLQKADDKLMRATPTILTCISTIGVVATAVLAVKATPKVLKLLETAADNKGEELTKLETVQVGVLPYIPAMITGVATVICVFGINVLNKRNQASLASAYAMLSESYRRYVKAAKVVYGEDADSKIKAEMAKDAYVSADGYSMYSLDDDTESERILCHDIHSNRYFTTTLAAVLNAEYHLNRNLQLRGWVSLNEFYDFLGIDDVPNGNKIGWCLDEMMTDGIMWLDFENGRTKLDDGMECLVISTLWSPLSDYMS